MSDVDNPPRRKRGRPRKSDVAASKKVIATLLVAQRVTLPSLTNTKQGC